MVPFSPMALASELLPFRFESSLLPDDACPGGLLDGTGGLARKISIRSRPEVSGCVFLLETRTSMLMSIQLFNPNRT